MISTHVTHQVAMDFDFLAALALFLFWDFAQRALTLARLSEIERQDQAQLVIAQATQTALVEKRASLKATPISKRRRAVGDGTAWRYPRAHFDYAHSIPSAESRLPPPAVSKTGLSSSANGSAFDAMNLRSLTGFLSLTDPLDDSPVRAFGELVRAGRDQFAIAGFPLQTTRIATQPLTEIRPRDLSQFARDIEAASKSNGIDYAALGAPRGDDKIADAIPAALTATESVFASVQITSRENGISFAAIQNAAHIICQLADAIPDGFGNFRFAALANCAPHSPFFPVAWHEGPQPAFAIATEGATLAVEAFSQANNLDEARSNLMQSIERTANNIAAVARSLSQKFAFDFKGIDFSMAPFPDAAHSIGAAIEKLTGAKFGEHGTLFASAFITDCIRRATFPRVGFSGLMLPVLEDSTLAQNSSRYSLDSLLLYSSVCGTGLDTIPLPGDTTQDALAAILLDLAALAVKLDKPLTARLIPLPGLHAGDMTRYDFKYFANARVMDGGNARLGILTGNRSYKF
jgi:uncharacterized protein (UPF0210 family)